MKVGRSSWKNRDSPGHRRSSNSVTGRRKITIRRSRPNSACLPKLVLRNRIAFGALPRSPFSAGCGPESLHWGGELRSDVYLNLTTLFRRKLTRTGRAKHLGLLGMSDEQKGKLRLAIAHILFIDIVGYSKLLIDEQSEALEELNRVVRNTEAARNAEAAGQLIYLPT